MVWVFLVLVIGGLMAWWHGPEFSAEHHIYKIAFVAFLGYIAGFLDSRIVSRKDKAYGNIVNGPEPQTLEEHRGTPNATVS